MKNNDKPAILSGKPVFKEVVPIVRPPIKEYINAILTEYKRILESGMITNFDYVKKLEKAVANYCNVNRCVATANCTSGLILALKALHLKNGEALIPSFTFPATAHAAYWSNLRIRLVDCDPKTFNISIAGLQEKITRKSKVLIPVHIFGNPCDTKAIDEIADDHALRTVYDAAHAFGAKYQGMPVGQFGDAEVFSGSPTKAFTTVEGGMVTTNNTDIAKTIEIGRNYGHYGDYNCEIPGLSARMSEFHAAFGLSLLPGVASDIERRNHLARKYEEGLGRLRGISFQKITPKSTSTYKDFGILIAEDKFGLNRDDLAISLEKENIMTRKYFYPPMHMQKCYLTLRTNDKTLPHTSEISHNILCLPMFSALTDNQVEKIIGAVTRIHAYANEVRHRLKRSHPKTR